MSVIDSSPTTHCVRRQYERLPFPHRDPEVECEQLRECDMDNLDILNHYCFRGRRDFSRGFTALVAGGGTGDSTVFLAHQLAATDASIVHLDLSEASIDVARRRVRQRNLEKNVSFVRGSILDLPDSHLGPFDYIQCSGVLHHLGDPSAGLACLREVLKDDGAIGLAVYGRFGRTAINQTQELMRLLNGDEQDQDVMLANTRETLDALPGTNWLRRVPNRMPPHQELDDANLFDMFLHSQDRPFSIPELYDLLDSAGLHLVEFIRAYRALYNPRVTFGSGRIRELAEKLPIRQQHATAEIFWGNISKHEFWASPRTDTTIEMFDPQNIPFFTALIGQSKLLEAISKPDCERWTMEICLSDSVKINIGLDLSEMTRHFISLIDGRRTLGRIVDTVTRGAGHSQTTRDTWDICVEILETLRVFDLALLRHASVASGTSQFAAHP